MNDRIGEMFSTTVPSNEQRGRVRELINELTYKQQAIDELKKNI